MMTQIIEKRRFAFQKQTLETREYSNKYRRAPPKLVHYLGFCI
jgi:hypothetical protein